MKRSKFSEEQVGLCAAPGRARDPGDRCLPPTGGERTHLLPLEEAVAHLGVSELRRMRQLEDEDRRLKGLVADLTLDKHMLSEALRKKG